jgi:hypothetical protein
MEEDAGAYGHDFVVVQAQRRADDPQARIIPWHRSAAKKLLQDDIDHGKHLRMKSRILHAMREEYQVFSLLVFCKHIYQEVDSQAKHLVHYKKKKLWGKPPPVSADRQSAYYNNKATV